MAAGFSITIGATDNATATTDRLNKRMAAVRAPAERLQKSLGKFADVSGLSGVARSFTRVSATAMGAFRSVARVVAPLGAITGAASLGGMYRLVESWAKWGSALGFAAQRIGITAGALQTFQGAAELSGASAGAMQSGLQALGQTMFDAVGGRATEATVAMNALGIAMQDGKGHARSVTTVLPELADKIASLKDPYLQAKYATIALGGAAEELLPFLRKGSAGMAEYERRAASFGVTSQGGIDGANKMRESFSSVSLAVTGLTNSIAERLAPIVSPMLDQLAQWASKLRTNKEFMDGLSTAVKTFGGFVQNIPFKSIAADLEGIGQRAESVAKFFGGWQRVLEAIVTIKMASWASAVLGPFGGLIRLMTALPAVRLALAGIAAESATRAGVIGYNTRAGQTDDQAAANYAAGQTGVMLPDKPKAAAWHETLGDRAYRYVTGRASPQETVNAFTGMGYGKADAAAIAAQVQAESSGNPFLPGDYVDGKAQAYGLIQAHADRQANYTKLYGHTMQSVTDRGQAMREQFGFVDWELHHTEKRAFGKLEEAQGADAKGAALARYYERPKAVDEASASRGAMAENIFNAAGGDSPVASQMASAAGAPSGAAGADGAKGKLEITVKHDGTGTVIARSTGDAPKAKIANVGVGVGNGST